MSRRSSPVAVLLGEAAPALAAGPGLDRDVPLADVHEGANFRTADDREELLPEAVSLLAADTVPVDELVHGFLPADITFLTGADGSLKTTSALAIATATAAGASPFDAWTESKPRRVLLVSEEDPLDVLQNRVQALVAGHGWNAAAVEQNLFCLALEGVHCDSEHGKRTIRANVAALDPALVVFDPLAGCIAGEENSNADAGRGVMLWRSLVRQGRAVLIVHHLGKPGQDGASRGPRGASAWRAAARAHYTVTRSDRGCTLTCDKMSRRTPPPPVELVLSVTTDSQNGAMWETATLTAPGQGDSYAVAHRRHLRPSERTALEALQRHADEGALSWAKWKDVSGIQSGNTISEARSRLLDLKLIEKVPTSRTWAGKAVFEYRITDDGLARLAEEAP